MPCVGMSINGEGFCRKKYYHQHKFWANNWQETTENISQWHHKPVANAHDGQAAHYKKSLPSTAPWH